MSKNIEGYKLKPFPCPNCNHEIFIGRIKTFADDEGMHEVGNVFDLTDKPLREHGWPSNYDTTQKDNT